MDQAKRAVSEAMRFPQILLHNLFHIGGWDAVQIENVGDGDSKGFGVFHIRIFAQGGTATALPRGSY